MLSNKKKNVKSFFNLTYFDITDFIISVLNKQNILASRIDTHSIEDVKLGDELSLI